MSAELAQFGINAILGISSGITAKAQVNANNTVNEANAWASNLVRAANNELGAARGSLARWQQSENNNRVLENTGEAATAAMTNYRRVRDSSMSDSLEQQIAFAEQAGAQVAASALSGLTGGVADIVASTTALRKARQQQRVDEATKQGDWDAQQQQIAIMRSGWDSMDMSEITDSLDYSNDVAQRQVSTGNFLTQVLGGQDSKTLANVSSQAIKFFKNIGSSFQI